MPNISFRKISACVCVCMGTSLYPPGYTHTCINQKCLLIAGNIILMLTGSTIFIKLRSTQPFHNQPTYLHWCTYIYGIWLQAISTP